VHYLRVGSNRNAMSQDIIDIPISDLVLWTENPRDPIDPKAIDQDIVDRAFEDRSLKWHLRNLASKMGPLYDFSELPIVVYRGRKPIVYDGNRRMILGKIKHGLVTFRGAHFDIPEIPSNIPCNVCSEDVALNHILRKHSDSGSWDPLERDIFLHKFMKRPKSTFLILEENTGIISSNPLLNQRFVKEEIFQGEAFKGLGFKTNDKGELLTIHSTDEAKTILSDVANKVENGIITTRKKRGKILEVLDPQSKSVISKNKNKSFKPKTVDFSTSGGKLKVPRQSRRTKKKDIEIFGGPLFLKAGDINNLYQDIRSLYGFYLENRATLSTTFPALIRMSLRLLFESAATTSIATRKNEMDDFITKYFSKAKGTLSQDEKTTLSNSNVKDSSILQLLHTGAHNYKVASQMESTLAVSLILGKMLELSHGK